MGNDDRYAAGHGLERRKTETLVKRRVHEHARQIIERRFVGIGDEAGKKDFVAIWRLCNRFKHFLALPPADPGDDQLILSQGWMIKVHQPLVPLYERQNILALFERRKR